MAILVGILVSAGVQAVSYVMVGDESMVERTPFVVYGSVAAIGNGSDEGVPAIHYEVLVEQVLKGDLEESSVTVAQAGGPDRDGTFLAVPGVPRLAVGDRVLLFLRPSGSRFRIVEAGLGMFWEVSHGERRVLRRDVELEALDSQGDEPGELTVRDSDGFREWIGRRASGREVEADYRIPAAAEGGAREVTSVESPFVHIEKCGGRSLRHSEFDSGKSVDFYFDADVEGYDLGFPAELGIASNLESVYRSGLLWNLDPGSNVRLDTLGTTRSKWRAGREDGRNAVMFTDPFGELGEPLSCGQGGVTGAAYVRWACNRGSRIPDTGETAVEITEVDIVIRDGFLACAEQYNGWTEFERLVAHEFGHALGLGHSKDINAVMRASSLYRITRPRGTRYNLGEDDIEGVRSLYRRPNHTGNTGCTPGDYALEFDFGYTDYLVWVCYETPEYEVGNATGELWSGVSGVAWFFDRSNPELLVKVLNGCPINKHMWVFVASATDLAFNLWVTEHPGGQHDSSRNWLHRNTQGGAGSRVDTAAFPCGR